MSGLGRPRWTSVGLAIGVALLLLLSESAVAAPVPPGPVRAGTATPFVGMPALPTSASTVAAIGTPLEVNNTSVNLSGNFWGSTVSNEVHLLRGETDAVNATPARVLVWPGAMAGEDYDPFTDTHYATDTGTPTHALTNESQFVQMCEATHCTAIMQVPAEIDEPSFAEEIVNYTEVNLSFRPAYWMIGNEPELWEHWKVPWADWPDDYTNGPNPTQFGEEVLAYVKAIRAVDNTTPILGLPASGCTCGYYTFEQWISGVLKVTGSQIQAVAFHEYPAGWLGTGDGSLQDFYGTLQSAAGIPPRIVGAREAVESACPGCNVTVFISELGSALSWSAYGQYADGFSGALSIASQITQAMDYNVSNIDLFATELATTNSWFAPSGYARPDYALYTEIFDHLGPEAVPVNLPGLDHTVYGIDTLAGNDGGRQDLLVVNDNITHAIAFTPAFAGDTGSAPVEAWSWNGSIHVTRDNDTTWVEPFTPNPVPSAYPDGLPGNYTLPPQSLVLFESYPSGASYVSVTAAGLPPSVPWYASVGNSFYTTTADNLSLLLPPGAYPVVATPVPLPIGGKELVPPGRLAGYVASPAYVSGSYTNVSVSYVPQWSVNVTASPLEDGSVTPDVGWWNASSPLTLTATPTLGYAFLGWSGWGPGSYNGTNRTITVLPAGRVLEKARFAVGEAVELEASGLAPGTSWSVTVRNFTSAATGPDLTLYVVPGRYGYTVSPVPGYRVLPQNGSFVVDTPGEVVPIRFVPIVPPQPTFPVQFDFSGLPVATEVSLTIRNQAETSWITTPSFDPEFALINGSYAYHVGYVPGYHVDVTAKTFSVDGGALLVAVPFVPTVYPVTWQANGTRLGMNWSLTLDGETMPASSAWISTTLPNGSYAYSVNLPSNYSANPRSGELVVNGFSRTLSLFFDPVEFPTLFEADGPGASTAWSVRLGNWTSGADGARSVFMAMNGTYTFDVHPPPGYYAVPSHGTLTVAGPDAAVEIQFHPSSERPSAALVSALSAGALGVAAWIGLSIFLGFVLVRRLRRWGG